VKAIVGDKNHSTHSNKKLKLHAALQADVGQRTYQVLAQDFQDPEREAEWLKSARATGTFRLRNLQAVLKWTPTAQRALISQLTAAEIDGEYVGTADGKGKGTFLEALLDVCPSVAQPDEVQSWLLLVLGVVAFCFVVPEAPLTQIAGKLKQQGVAGYSVARLRKLLSQVREAIERRSASNGVPVRQVWPDLPADVASELVLPPGWAASPAEIRSEANRRGPAVSPLFIDDCFRNDQTHEHSVRLWYLGKRGWQSRIVSQEVIADRAKIVALAAYDVGVNSNNAATAVQYLADFATANQAKLAPHCVTAQLGWQHHGARVGFLLGHELLSPSSTTDPSHLHWVTFQGNDDGDHQLANGYRCKGQLAVWKQAVAKLEEFPTAVLLIAASFAPPLLEILDVGSFSIDLAGVTTSGKTTQITYAASVWGVNDPAHADSLVRPFNATSVCRERMLQTLRHVPTFVDETKLAQDNREVAQFIYLVGQGRSRGRGSPKGIQAQQSTRTITFLTGEQPATHFTQDAGTRARVLTSWGPPFGEISPRIGKLISALNAVVRENYGHAGRQYVQYLLDTQLEWPRWRNRFAIFVETYEREGGSNNYARRLAPCLAVIRLAAEIAAKAHVYPFSATDPIAKVYPQLAREAGDANRPAAALCLVVSYALRHLAELAHNGVVNAERRPREVLGNLVSYEIPGESPLDRPCGWRQIQVDPEVVRRVLVEAGFHDAQALMRTWRDVGWIAPGDGDHLAKYVTIGKQKIRMICITARGHAAADRAIGGSRPKIPSSSPGQKKS
jgi:hypothetical protein